MIKFYSISTLSKTLLLAVLSFVFTTGLKAQAINALRYDGAQSDYTTLPAGIVSTLTGDFMIEFWVYWQGFGATTADSANINVQPNFQRVFDFGNNTNEWMWFTPSSDFGTFGALFAISLTGGPGAQFVQSPSKLALNAWSHVAITLVNSTNTLNLFINGVLVATTPGVTLRADDLGSTVNNWLGRSQFPTDPYFHGIIDEFRISNNVRYTTGFTPKPIQFVVDANTVALYHFNEGTGQTSANAQTGPGAAILGGTVAVEGVDPEWISNSILPVNMVKFGVEKAGSKVILDWKASVSGEGGKFIITRSSNGRDFSEIGAISFTAGTTVQDYSFTDAAPLNGKNFYRLEIAESFAPVKYSSIVWVDMNDKADYGVYPSAAVSEIFIKTPRGVKVSVFNDAGALVKRIQLQNSQLVNISDLSKGNYFIQFEGTVETIRFIKL